MSKKSVKKAGREIDSRTLGRLAAKATSSAAQTALELNGNKVVAEKGWIVKKDASGKVIEKISRIKNSKTDIGVLKSKS